MTEPQSDRIGSSIAIEGKDIVPTFRERVEEKRLEILASRAIKILIPDTWDIADKREKSRTYIIVRNFIESVIKEYGLSSKQAAQVTWAVVNGGEQYQLRQNRLFQKVGFGGQEKPWFTQIGNDEWEKGLSAFSETGLITHSQIKDPIISIGEGSHVYEFSRQGKVINLDKISPVYE